MRVLIADDNELVRRGIASLLSGENELEVCGEASDAIETLKKADELSASLVHTGPDRAERSRHLVEHS